MQSLMTATEATLCAALFALCAGTAHAAPPGGLPFGAYDPGGSFADDPQVTIEHVFLPWENVEIGSLVAADAYAVERGRALLVTIEPWTWSRDARNTPDALREGIASGAYDGNMRAICAVLDTLQSPVSVRWGHEMETDKGQFIWAAWEPDDYVAAFRRMIDTCRAVAPRINVVWSPLGEEGLAAYYPGDAYVDLVGLSIFGLQAWETEILGAPRSYNDVLLERYPRAAAFGKPVVVAEVGYSGDADYVALWESQVRNPPPGLDQLVGAVYFNQAEVYPWPDGFGLPDWTVENRVIDPALTE